MLECHNCPYGITDEFGKHWIGCWKFDSYINAQNAYMKFTEDYELLTKEELEVVEIDMIRAFNERAEFHERVLANVKALNEVNFRNNLKEYKLGLFR